VHAGVAGKRPLKLIAGKPEIDGELRASFIKFDAIPANRIPLRRKTRSPSPRPSATNIGLKFEWCFKGRDESNLNAAIEGRAPALVKHENACNIERSGARQQSVNLRDWHHDNHCAKRRDADHPGNAGECKKESVHGVVEIFPRRDGSMPHRRHHPRQW
jgi:hypothetical protein